MEVATLDLCREEIADCLVFCFPDGLGTRKSLELAGDFGMIAADEINDIAIDISRSQQTYLLASVSGVMAQ